MAKALFGHVGGSNMDVCLAEIRRLRSKVAELEHDLALAHASLAASVTVEDDLSTLALEPAEPAYS
jgi:hypothetical protein